MMMPGMLEGRAPIREVRGGGNHHSLGRGRMELSMAINPAI